GLRVNGTLYRLTAPVAQARATTPPPASAAPAAQEDPFARAQARVEGPAELPPAAAAPAAPAPASAPARRGPGRPPGAKNKKTLEREASAAVQAAVAAGQDPRGVLTAPAAPVAPVARDESRM